jgi:hypothetical protein
VVDATQRVVSATLRVVSVTSQLVAVTKQLVNATAQLISAIPQSIARTVKRSTLTVACYAPPPRITHGVPIGNAVYPKLSFF